MQLKSLLLKANDGVKLLLAQPTMLIRFLDRKDQLITERHTVEEDEAGRPDLIAIKYYGEHAMTDVLLKFNGISDPFSINSGDVIMIPPVGIGYYKLERPTTTEDNPIKQLYMDTKNLPKEDANRLEVLKRKYNKENLLPPNVIPSGKKAYKFLPGGAVQFGMQAQTDPVNETGLTLSGGDLPNEDINIQTTQTELGKAKQVESVNDKAIKDFFEKNNKPGKADKTATNKPNNANPNTGSSSGTKPGCN
jgi:hypothetical protein